MKIMNFKRFCSLLCIACIVVASITIDISRKENSIGFGFISNATTQQYTVVNQPYDISSNKQRSMVRLSNNWLVASLYEGNSVNGIYKSVDNGGTWQRICYISNLSSKGTIVSFGTRVTCIINGFSFTFDATTVSNTDLYSIRKNIGYPGSYSAGVDETGVIHAVFTLSGIGYCKSTDGGNTWQTRMLESNYSYSNETGGYGYGFDNPCIAVVNSNKIIVIYNKSGGSGGSFGNSSYSYSQYGILNNNIFSGGFSFSSYLGPISTAVDNSGCAHAIYQVSNSDSIYYKRTNEQGVWSAETQIGTSVLNASMSICTDSDGKIYVVYPGIDGALKQKISDGSTFGNETNLCDSAAQSSTPSLIDDRTLDNVVSIPILFKDTQANTVIYQGSLNEAPGISIMSPTSNSILSEFDISVLPQISVSDSDGDTLTCEYFIDSESIPRDNKTVSNTTNSQTVTFGNFNINGLSEGNHSLRFEVTDGITSPVSQLVAFKIDKSSPQIGSMNVTSTISSITVSGSATDAIAGLADYPYRYTIGDHVSSWVNVGSYSFEQLLPNTLNNIKFEARDKNGHIASNTSSIYTKGVTPVLSISNCSSYTIDVLTQDINAPSTQYLISTHDGSSYVTPEGTLTTSPIWVTLVNKSITIKGLQPGTTYTFQAKARNGNNIETTFSSPVTGTTLVAPPGTPTNITAVATNNSITLAWNSFQGSSGYDVEADGQVVSNINSTTYTHTNLAPGSQHTYRIRAINPGGYGDWSSPILKSTLPNPPVAPIGLAANATNTSITILWSSVDGANAYDIEVDGQVISNGISTNYVHSGLIPGTYHTYRVRSINSGGKSEWSAVVNVSTTIDAPLIPVNISSVPLKNSITLTWDPVADATSYDVDVDGIVINCGSLNTFTHAELAPGTQHMYRVRSRKGSTASDWTSIIIASTIPDSFGVPGNLKVEASSTKAVVSWDPVPGAILYDIEADGVLINDLDTTTCIHDNLEPNTQHIYRVRAKSSTEVTEWSELVAITTYFLDTPVILNSLATDTSVTSVWEAVYGADSYDYEFDSIIVGNVAETMYTSTGLLPNTKHILRVRAVNAQGTSAWSIPMIKATVFNEYNVPEGVTAISTQTSIRFLWKPMESAAGYDMEVDGSVIEGLAGESYYHGNLSPGTQHTYRVRAKREDGASSWSRVHVVWTLPSAPMTPTNVMASSTLNSILITWDPVEGANSYELEVDGLVVDIGSGTSYIHSSLTPGSAHTYRVRAINDAGRGLWSEPVSISTRNSTDSYMVDVQQGLQFGMMLTASGIEQPTGYIFTITYNPEELDVVDLCSLTPKEDMSAGKIAGTDIEIVQFVPGSIVLVKTGVIAPGQTWSGVINAIKLTSRIDGQTEVTLSID